MSEKDVVARTGNKPLTVSSLREDLEKLGVKKGMTLIVHSSLSSIGWVSGGAVAVIKSLREAVGDEGTIVMPAHSGDLSNPAGWNHPPVPKSWHKLIKETMPAFDVDLTPTRGMGTIAEVFRKNKNVLRSNHPQLSFTAEGPKSKYITDNHSLEYALGDNSPLAKLYELDGWILLLGVDHDRNTSLHLAECRADYSSKEFSKEESPILVDGKREWVVFDDLDYNSDDFLMIGKSFIQENKDSIYIGKVGLAYSQLISQRNLVDFSIEWMNKNRK